MKSLFRPLVIATLITGFANPALAAREVNTKDFSGWMDDYDSLSYVEERNAFVFFNEAARGKYKKVMVDSVTVYARDAEKDTTIAMEASAYLNDGIVDLLVSKDLLAEQAGPDVLKLKIAITGVEKSKEDLKPYNFIPVSAVFRVAQTAAGKVATYIDAMFEAELIDSVSGERAAAIVTKGISETEKRSGDELTFDDVKPTLDLWLAQYNRTLDEFLASR